MVARVHTFPLSPLLRVYGLGWACVLVVGMAGGDAVAGPALLMHADRGMPFLVAGETLRNACAFHCVRWACESLARYR